MVDTKAFLARVLPASGGDYFVGTVYPSGFKQGAPISTIDELVRQIEDRKRRKGNVFYATGVYDGERTQEKAVLKKALYVDLDCKGSHQGFATKKDAVLALKKFCADARFPFPNIVVDSGNGIHGYWVFDQPIPAAEWQTMADALAQLCECYEFKVDSSITNDSARILRVPGTFNYKNPAYPIECRILRYDVQDFDVASLRDALGVAVQAPASQLTNSVDYDDLGANLYRERVYNAGNVIQNCGVLKHSVDIGGKGQAGVFWHKVLHLLAFCEDGRDFIHPVSDQHDEYSPDRTERRFAYALKQKARGVGPTLCKTFSQFYPSKCAACPFNGKIKTPLVLGKAEESYLPPSYKMTNEGVWKAVSFNERGQAEDWNLVFPYNISSVGLITDGHNISLRFVLTAGPISKTIVIPVVLLAADTKEIQAEFMRSEIYPTDAQVKEFKQVMIPWVRKMSMVKQAMRASIAGLGWVKLNGLTGFATGTTIYMENGSEEQVSGLERQLCRDYAIEGEPSLWFSAAQDLIADGCQPVIAGVLSAFAAPLINFTGVSGVMFSLYSAQSGTGKSSALRVAQSVWGNPQRGVNALHDTALSVAKKMGFLNNLPAYWDELRMREEVQSLIKMIFQLGQGKERARLTSSAKMQDMGTWATMITVATNEPILDHIDHVITNTNAGRLRVFEVTVPQRQLTNVELPFKLKELDVNHGHLGHEYAKFLARNHTTVRQLVQDMQRKVVADLQASNDERFWIATVSTLLLAAMICNKQGWLTVDLPAFRRWLYAEFHRQRGTVAKTYLPLDQKAIQAMLQFSAEMRDGIAVVDHLTTRTSKSVGAIHIQPVRGEIIGVLALKDRRFRVKKSSFASWVYSKLKDSPSEIVAQLLAAGAVETRASVTAGIVNTLDARVYALEFDLTNPNFAPLLEGN